MNGRAYDPLLGRFLSVDPIIQFPANSQSLNPYSYILNNPLAGTDPTGYCAETTGTRIRSCDVKVTKTYSDGSTRTERFNSRSSADMGRMVATVNRAVGQMMNGANVSQSSVGSGRTDGAKEGGHAIGGTPSKKDVLSVTQHSDTTFAEDGTPSFTPSPMPRRIINGLRDAFSSSVGRQVFNHLRRAGERLHFAPGEEGDFEYNPEYDVIFYGDMNRYRRSSTVAGDGAGSATLGAVFMHEIGHTPLGAAAIGQTSTTIYRQESVIGGRGVFTLDLGEVFKDEYRVIRSFENPYRMERGLPLRRSYFEENDIMWETMRDIWRGR